jgi:hypothetical protein
MQTAFLEKAPDIAPADDLNSVATEIQPLPGDEFPRGVYIGVFAAYLWMFGTAWAGFAAPGGTDLDLMMATVLAVVFFGIPFALYRTARTRLISARPRISDFLNSHVDTFTGPMPAKEAWIEIMLIPLALAAAATLIGGAHVLVG